MLTLACAITFGLVSERAVYAFVCMIFYLLNQGPDRKSVWFVSSLTQYVLGAAASMLSSAFRLLSFSFRGLVWLMLIVVIWGLLYALARDGSEALIAFQAAYNSSVGGILRLLIVLPLQLLQLLWQWVVPFYNLVIYCLGTIPIRVLYENALLNIDILTQAAANIGLFMQALVVSCYNYVQLIIHQPDSFDPNLRLMDLITPLGYFRLAVSYVLSWLGQICSIATGLTDILFYPFLDINFGLCVHNTLNSLLTLFVQTPIVTINRCRAGGGPLVYCLPDFEPTFELAVNGIRNFGQLIDNWMDVTSLIIQAMLTGTNPACTSGWADFTAATSSDALFGSNETLIVGVDSTSVAKTDGWNIALYLQSGVVQTFPGAFPSAVDINYGIAVVSATPDIVGLLGCACTNLAYGMQIVCAVAPMDMVTPSYYVPVQFDVPTTSFYMGCSASKIRLDSIRWPVTRFTSPNSNVVQPGSLIAQAALWVRPDCSDQQIDVACVQTFALSGCYPYCMALWTQGYVGSMILRGANEWSNTVAMVQRDCGLSTWNVESGTLASVTQKLLASAGVTSAWIASEVQIDSSSCVYSPNIFSRIMRNATPAYNAYPSVVLSGQPFAFAGDLVLTAVNTVGNTWGIDVQRIYGNQVSSLAARKRSDDGEHLSGALFHVFDACGELIQRLMAPLQAWLAKIGQHGHDPLA